MKKNRCRFGINEEDEDIIPVKMAAVGIISPPYSISALPDYLLRACDISEHTAESKFSFSSIK